MTGASGEGFMCVDFTAPQRKAPMIHKITEPPACRRCAILEPGAFNVSCEACMKLLTDPAISVAQIFAIIRQWLPYIQQRINIFIDEILKRGAHVNDKDGLTDMAMLHYVCKSGCEGIGDLPTAIRTAKMLVDKGADIRIRCRWTEMTPLHYAAYFNVPELIKLLTKCYRGNVYDVLNERCSEADGGTALHICAENLCVDAAQCLLQLGANVNVRDNHQRTAKECIPSVALGLSDPTSPDDEEVSTLSRILLQYFIDAESNSTPNHPNSIPNHSNSSPNHHKTSPSHHTTSPSHHETSPSHTDSPPSHRQQPSPRHTSEGEMDGFHIGDKVLVAGIKVGYLRYFGKCNFSPGIWAGVELPEPVGKNDGSVQGVQYFNCHPLHGIFAPVNKVSPYIPHPADRSETFVISDSSASTSPRHTPHSSFPPPSHSSSQLSHHTPVPPHHTSSQPPHHTSSQTPHHLSSQTPHHLSSQTPHHLSSQPPHHTPVPPHHTSPQHKSHSHPHQASSHSIRPHSAVPASRSSHNVRSRTPLSATTRGGGGGGSGGGGGGSSGGGGGSGSSSSNISTPTTTRQRRRAEHVNKLPPMKLDLAKVSSRIDTGLYSARYRSGSESSDQHFDIGDRICLSGDRKGVIRYAGTTKFAPGLWYGIELDKPRGRNDGCIEGVRYFTCQPLHGVFAPPTRIIRLSKSISGSTDSLSSTDTFIMDKSETWTSATSSKKRSKKHFSLPPQPPERCVEGVAGDKPPRALRSVRDRVCTPPMPRRNTPLHISKGEGRGTPVSAESFKLECGMSVYINNQIGIVRYVGDVEFAPGTWLGIELPTAAGKNDGSVMGRRYFTCSPSHGLLVRPNRVSVRGVRGGKLVRD